MALKLLVLLGAVAIASAMVDKAAPATDTTPPEDMKIDDLPVCTPVKKQRLCIKYFNKRLTSCTNEMLSGERELDDGTKIAGFNAEGCNVFCQTLRPTGENTVVQAVLAAALDTCKKAVEANTESTKTPEEKQTMVQAWVEKYKAAGGVYRDTDRTVVNPKQATGSLRFARKHAHKRNSQKVLLKARVGGLKCCLYKQGSAVLCGDGVRQEDCCPPKGNSCPKMASRTRGFSAGPFTFMKQQKAAGKLTANFVGENFPMAWDCSSTEEAQCRNDPISGTKIGK